MAASGKDWARASSERGGSGETAEDAEHRHAGPSLFSAFSRTLKSILGGIVRTPDPTFFHRPRSPLTTHHSPRPRSPHSSLAAEEAEEAEAAAESEGSKGQVGERDREEQVKLEEKVAEVAETAKQAQTAEETAAEEPVVADADATRVKRMLNKA